MAAGPGSETRRRRPWNYGAASPSSSFSSGSSSVCRRLPSPGSLVPGASGDCSGDAVAIDAAAAAVGAEVAREGGGEVVVAEEEKGSATRLTSAVLGSPGNQQHQQQRAGAVSPTWSAEAGRLYDSVTSDSQEGGGGGGNGDVGRSSLSRPSAAVKPTAEAAAKKVDARGLEPGRRPASFPPSPQAASVVSAPASAPASAPPCYEEALARSAALSRSMPATGTIPPTARRAEAPATATARRAHEGDSSGPNSETTTTVGGGSGVKFARQMWERRASSFAELQDRAADSPRVNQASQRSGSGHERRPSSAETGAGQGVANMKVKWN